MVYFVGLFFAASFDFSYYFIVCFCWCLVCCFDLFLYVYCCLLVFELFAFTFCWVVLEMVWCLAFVF